MRRPVARPEEVVIKLAPTPIVGPDADLWRRARNGDREADRIIRRRLGSR